MLSFIDHTPVGLPIIQDGKLVGAVTHVMVNDPTAGYGIFIENMLSAASAPMARAAHRKTRERANRINIVPAGAFTACELPQGQCFCRIDIKFSKYVRM